MLARPVRLLPLLAGPLLAALAFAAPASAQSGQTVSFPISPGYFGGLPVGQTPLAGEVALGVADLAETGGSLDATLWVGEGYAFDGATAPGFAIFDRTLRVESSLDPAAGRYQIQFDARALRAGLRFFQDFAGIRFVQYDGVRAGRARFARVRMDLRRSLRRMDALDPQTERIRFGRFARALRVMRYAKDERRWRPAWERVGRRYDPLRLIGRRATFTPGHYGWDPQSQLVWSVQDGDGAYALGFPVPESSGLVGLGVGACALATFSSRRRRRGRGQVGSERP